MLMSFYLAGEIFFRRNTPPHSIDTDTHTGCSRESKRLWRVCYPQVAWAVIYFIILSITAAEGMKPMPTDFLWQVFTGHSDKLNATMWFQTDLIAITLLYLLLFKFQENEKAVLLTQVSFFCALVMQYTGLNSSLFGDLRFELKYPLGRFCEMLPYAALGISCAYFNVFERLKRRRLFFIPLFAVISAFLLKYKVMTEAPGFGNSDSNCIPLAFFVTAFAFLLPLENLPGCVKKALGFITRYTLGIYCMHRLVMHLISLFLPRQAEGTESFVLCLAAYGICFLISFLISRIPLKPFRQLVS